MIIITVVIIMIIGFDASHCDDLCASDNKFYCIHSENHKSKFHSENSDARVAEHYHSETIYLSNGHCGRRNARVIPPKEAQGLQLRFIFVSASAVRPARSFL